MTDEPGTGAAELAPPPVAPSTGEISRRRLWIAIGLSAATELVMAFTGTATNIAFPSIEESFSAPRTTLAWAITGFSIVQASLMLVSGRLADRVGRKRIYERGLWVFTIASLACAAAPTGGVFVGFRLAQGVGAAIVVPSALALVLHEVPASRRIWVATMSAAIFSVGQSASPLVGALLTQAVSWRLVYVLPALMCVVTGVVGRRVFRESKAGASGRIDVVGVVLGSLGIAALAFGTGQGPVRGWTDAWVVTALCAAAVLLPLVVLRSRRHPDPLFDPALFRLRSVWSASAATVLTTAVGLGAWLAWPLLLTQTLGYSILETGLLLTPVPIVMAISAFAGGGRTIDRFGARAVVQVGVLAWVVGLGLLVVQMGRSPDYARDLLPGFLVCGIGYGLTMGPLQGLALRDVAHDVFAQVNALILTFRFVGSALGAAVTIGLIGNLDPPPITGFQRAHEVLLGVAVASGVVGCFLPARAPKATTVTVGDDEQEIELAAEMEARTGT